MEPLQTAAHPRLEHTAMQALLVASGMLQLSHLSLAVAPPAAPAAVDLPRVTASR